MIAFVNVAELSGDFLLLHHLLNSMGFIKFNDLKHKRSYTIIIRHKHYSFSIFLCMHRHIKIKFI
jgi:hypothetical protein